MGGWTGKVRGSRGEGNRLDGDGSWYVFTRDPTGAPRLRRPPTVGEEID